jgi:hypothetical protein
MATKTVTPKLPALPEGITLADLKYPDYKSPVKHLYDFDFEIWHTERFGWCIPTLTIAGVSGRARARNIDAVRRTYAIAVNDGQQVRVGLGPHVKAHHQVYVTEANLARMQKFIDLQGKGAESANDTRDRISTRRLQTSMRRRDHNWFM